MQTLFLHRYAAHQMFTMSKMGESYYNNHHKFGGRANFGGFRWHEFDPAYPLLKVLDAQKIVKLRVGRDEAYR